MKIVEVKSGVYEIDDYKKHVRARLPCIDIINFSKEDDELIQKRFLERCIAYENAITENGSFEGRTCLFDRVFDAQEKDEHAKAILRFINENIISVMSGLDEQLKIKFKPTLRDLFVNFDVQGSQSHFLSRVGEIALVAKILTKEELSIIDIEYRLQNSKSIDLVIKQDSTELLMEIYNIMLRMDKVDSSDNLKKFLKREILNKINNKLNGLDKSILKKFVLIPILWGELDEFMKYDDVLNWLLEYKNVIVSPYGIYYCHFPKGETRYILETINNVRKIRTEQ